MLYIHVFMKRIKIIIIDENATIKAIDYIENKSSSGHDGISNIRLK